MMLRDLGQLARTTIRDPARAARTLLACPVGREVLWSALILAAVLNTLLFSLSGILLPTPQAFPVLFSSPLVYFALVTLGLVGFIQFLAWVGRLLGGQGDFTRVMVLLVWLQYLRLLVQAVVLLLLLTFPFLSLLLVMAASLVGLFILLHFIMQAHQLASLGRAAVVLILAMLAMAVALSVLLALVGAPIMGNAYNV